jgi:hypothetical protein
LPQMPRYESKLSGWALRGARATFNGADILHAERFAPRRMCANAGISRHFERGPIQYALET